jgi:hypothetical protein
MNVDCAYCSKTFKTKPSKFNKSKSGLMFCCREHKDLSTRKDSNIPIKPNHYYGINRIELICFNCKSTYQVAKYRVKKSRYCSRICMNKAKVIKDKTEISLICALCSKSFLSYHEDKFCSYCRVSLWRTNTKRKAVEYMGNKCLDCQKQYHLCEYDFHHLFDKDFGIARATSWLKIEAELKKCVLLCSNCHRLRHHKNSVDYKIEALNIED